MSEKGDEMRRSTRPIIILHGLRVDPRYYVGCVGIGPEDGYHPDGEMQWTVLHKHPDGTFTPEYGLYHWGEQRGSGRWLYVYGTRAEVERYGELEKPIVQGKLL